MSFSPEQIPNHIFDWLETVDFENLSAEKQEEVKAWLSADEYQEMRHTLVAIKASKVNSANLTGSRKARLMEHFDTVYPNKKTAVTKIHFWQMAAGFLLLLCGGLLFQKWQVSPEKSPVMAAIRDTVYLVKNAAPEMVRVHDTVYLAVPSAEKTASVQTVVRTKNPNSFNRNTTPSSAYTAVADTRLVLPVESVESSRNDPKGNSMKDDSLLRKYSFVSM
jgi:hypothetical protein